MDRVFVLEDPSWYWVTVAAIGGLVAGSVWMVGETWRIGLRRTPKRPAVPMWPAFFLAFASLFTFTFLAFLYDPVVGVTVQGSEVELRRVHSVDRLRAGQIHRLEEVRVAGKGGSSVGLRLVGPSGSYPTGQVPSARLAALEQALADSLGLQRVPDSDGRPVWTVTGR